MRQWTILTNALIAHLAELGIIAAQGSEGLSSQRTHFNTVRDTLPSEALLVS